MSEKLTPDEVDGMLLEMRTQAQMDIETIDKSFRGKAIQQFMLPRRLLYERRIAALDAVLAERRERQVNGH